MILNYKKNGNVIIVYLDGRLEDPYIDEIENEIKTLIEEETSSHVVLNLRGAKYVSSSGIALFVSIMNALKQKKKKFGICDLESPVKRIMELVEMGVLFYIFKDENEALELLSNES